LIPFSLHPKEGCSLSITMNDVREALGLYKFMKEGRDILMTPMGRALIREAQVGGCKWQHLYHIKNGPSLWDGKDEGKMNVFEDQVAMEILDKELKLFNSPEPSIYQLVCNEIVRAATVYQGICVILSLFYYRRRGAST
jgi:hypothetical protein